MLPLLAHLCATIAAPAVTRTGEYVESLFLFGSLGAPLGAVVGFILGAIYGQSRAHEVVDRHE